MSEESGSSVKSAWGSPRTEAIEEAHYGDKKFMDANRNDNNSNSNNNSSDSLNNSNDRAGKTVYLTRFNPETTEEMLRDLLAPYGTIRNISLKAENIELRKSAMAFIVF